MKFNTGAVLATSVVAISAFAILAKASESHTPDTDAPTAQTTVHEIPSSSSSQTRASAIRLAAGSYSPPLNCDVAQINPAEFKSTIHTSDCIAGWMLTWSDCLTDCEGLGLWHASENYWTRPDFYAGYVYTSCFSYENMRYGVSPNEDVYISLQLMFTTRGCNDEELDYHPEPPNGPLKFGDIGKRVKALQRALIEQGYFVESEGLGPDASEPAQAKKADGIYGPITIRSVMNLQYMSGLIANGIADQSTFDALGIESP